MDKLKEAEYNKKYKATWYKKNRRRLIEQSALRRQEIKDWFAELKSSFKCEKCSFSHPAALDFHHKEGRGTKKSDVSDLANYGASKETILAEIEKCEVLCSNCHRILHYEDKMGLSSNGKTQLLQS